MNIKKHNYLAGKKICYFKSYFFAPCIKIFLLTP